MSANLNLRVNSKRFYFAFHESEKKLPRVAITVEGYEFIFTCGERLRPIIVTESGSVHAQIKRTAFAHAAILFKKTSHLTRNDSTSPLSSSFADATTCRTITIDVCGAFLAYLSNPQVFSLASLFFIACVRMLILAMTGSSWSRGKEPASHTTFV